MPSRRTRSRSARSFPAPARTCRCGRGSAPQRGVMPATRARHRRRCPIGGGAHRRRRRRGPRWRPQRPGPDASLDCRRHRLTSTIRRPARSARRRAASTLRARRSRGRPAGRQHGAAHLDPPSANAPRIYNPPPTSTDRTSTTSRRHAARYSPAADVAPPHTRGAASEQSGARLQSAAAHVRGASDGEPDARVRPRRAASALATPPPSHAAPARRSRRRPLAPPPRIFPSGVRAAADARAGAAHVQPARRTRWRVVRAPGRRHDLRRRPPPIVACGQFKLENSFDGGDLADVHGRNERKTRQS